MRLLHLKSLSNLGNAIVVVGWGKVGPKTLDNG